jgi:APA family basic amino acid/polyamine antiporter
LALNSCDDRFALAACSLKFVERRPLASVPPSIQARHRSSGNPDFAEATSGLTARLGIFDATMVVMGGIIGSGIFINSYVVAKLVHTPAMILGAWLAGGLLALIGAFIYAELANRMPKVGGQYAYIREAYDPLLGFLYGWVSILVINAGGTAAVAVTFGKYFREFSRGSVPENVAAISVVVVLTAVNCVGVRAGSGVQSFFMVLRVLAIVMIVCCGAWFLFRSPAAPHPSWHPLLDRPASFDLLAVFGAALIPVIFAYGGWQTSNYIASEIREPRKNLPKALLMGVAAVIALYVSINIIYVEVLSPAGLAATTIPASAAMFAALGHSGSMLIAAAIAISTVGFLSQAMLTYPRVAFAMAQDGMLPRTFARLGSRSHVPVPAIILQGVITSAAVLLGTFEQLLSYVVVMDWLFFGLTASCIFVFRRREAPAQKSSDAEAGFRIPGHPWTTGLFVLVAWLIVLNTIYKYPRNAGAAVCILLAGVPVYYLLRRRATRTASSE